MSATAATFDTPKLFAAQGARAHSRALVVSLLSLILLVGFGLRAYHLSAEGLSEDELNKLNAVADYRAHGLTSANGEHPFLMKALLTLSVLASEQRWKTGSLTGWANDTEKPDWKKSPIASLVASVGVNVPGWPQPRRRKSLAKAADERHDAGSARHRSRFLGNFQCLNVCRS